MRKILVAVGVVAALVPISAQQTAPAKPVAPASKPAPAAAKPVAKGWGLPRTPDGKPGPQGHGTNATQTPHERLDGGGAKAPCGPS